MRKTAIQNAETANKNAELIKLITQLVAAGNNMAEELHELVQAARESGCQLAEAEHRIAEWEALLENDAQKAH